MWVPKEETFTLSTWNHLLSQAMSSCGIKPLNCEFCLVLSVGGGGGEGNRCPSVQDVLSCRIDILIQNNLHISLIAPNNMGKVHGHVNNFILIKVKC